MTDYTASTAAPPLRNACNHTFGPCLLIQCRTRNVPTLETMLTYKLSAYCGLVIVFHVLVAIADLGPYFRSISYEHAGQGKWPQQFYHSSDTIGPILNIQRYDDGCDNGQYIFLSVIGSEVNSAGPMILDEHGNLIWTSPYGRNWGLDVQMLGDQPYLTFCAWPGTGSHVTCHMVGTRSAFVVKRVLKGRHTVKFRI